jgi:hypothetical protein
MLFDGADALKGMIDFLPEARDIFNTRAVITSLGVPERKAVIVENWANGSYPAPTLSNCDFAVSVGSRGYAQ